MRKQYTLLSTAALLLAAASGYSQNVSYEDFKAPVYRYASDQRFSEHKNIYYKVDADSMLLFPMVHDKYLDLQYSRDSIRRVFRETTSAELKRMPVNDFSGEQDLTIEFFINDLNVTEVQSGSSFNTGPLFTKAYQVTGSMRERIYNRQGQEYSDRNVDLSGKIILEDEEKVNTPFNLALTPDARAQNKYRMLMHLVKAKVNDRQDVYVNHYRDLKISLPFIYRASKKYPDLALIDSMNQALVAELKKKNATDYTEMIAPYEQQYADLLKREFPQKYSVKQIKIAAYGELAFLYYLSYNKEKLQGALDSLYIYSNKVFGIRGDYQAAMDWKNEIDPYFASAHVPKYPVDSFSKKAERVPKAIQMAGWIELNSGDTIKGKHVGPKGIASVLSLGFANSLNLETKEGDKLETKTYKIADVKSFQIGDRLYEIHKYKTPPEPGSNSINLGSLKTKEMPMQVLYSSDKIKVLKENFSDNSSNAVLLIRPGETELTNPAKGFLVINKAKVLKAYLKDSDLVMKKLSEQAYDLDKEEAMVQVAADYTSSKQRK